MITTKYIGEIREIIAGKLKIFLIKTFRVFQGTKLWIIMEYLGGGSGLDLMKPGVFDETYIIIILREVLKGLDYLHMENKLHRDIKGWSYFLVSK